jgi:rare lipoprotein A
MKMKRKCFIFFILITTAFLTSGCDSKSGNSSPTAAETNGAYQQGIASWYGAEYHGKQTASGEIFDKNALTAAHREISFGTYVDVTNLENGRRVTVKINDRGPFVSGRIIDLSERAADDLGMKIAGLAEVSLKITSGP